MRVSCRRVPEVVGVTAMLAALGCRGREPSQAFATPGDLVGTWRCNTHHYVDGSDTSNTLSIVFQVAQQRWAVSFKTDPGAAEPFESLADWHHDAKLGRYVHQARIGDEETEELFSPGPSNGRLVWEGDIKGSISFPMRVTYHLTAPKTLEVLHEGNVENAWKVLSLATCKQS